MTEWKFGTVLKSESDGGSVVMICGRGGNFQADDGYLIRPDYLWGITLAIPVGVSESESAFGAVGGTTWIPENGEGRVHWDWEVLDG